MAEENRRRNMAARLLYLFAALMAGSALLSQYWKNHRAEKETHDYPTALGDTNVAPRSASRVSATVAGESVVLRVLPDSLKHNDRSMRRIGSLKEGGASVYVVWASLTTPQATPAPEPAGDWYVKVAPNNYRKVAP